MSSQQQQKEQDGELANGAKKSRALAIIDGVLKQEQRGQREETRQAKAGRDREL
jgi:hypothetical protein